MPENCVRTLPAQTTPNRRILDASVDLPTPRTTLTTFVRVRFTYVTRSFYKIPLYSLSAYFLLPTKQSSPILIIASSKLRTDMRNEPSHKSAAQNPPSRPFVWRKRFAAENVRYGSAKRISSVALKLRLIRVSYRLLIFPAPTLFNLRISLARGTNQD